MHFTPLLYTSLAVGTAFAVPVSDPSIDKRAGNFKFFGVNEAGPEFGNQNLPGKNYTVNEQVP